MRLILLICLILMPVTLVAQTVGDSTGLPLPRFVSLRGDQVYSRTGPGTRYPIKWVYQRKNLPVEIIQEFDNWRKIRDIDGEEGWVHQSLLSGSRYVVQNAGQAIPMHKKPADDARAVALIESRAVMSLEGCTDNWCEVQSSGYEGWVAYNSIWGVYEGERIE